MPVDALAWTENTSSRCATRWPTRKRLVPNARGELRITGQATALAKKELKALGWSVVDVNFGRRKRLSSQDRRTCSDTSRDQCP